MPRRVGACALRLGPVRVEREFERVERFTQCRELCAELSRAGGGGGALVFVLLQLGGDPFAFGSPRRRRAQERQDLEIAHAGGDFAVTLRAPHLRIELGDAPFELGDQVVDADRVLFGRVQPPQRLVLARQELADPGGFLEQRAAFGRLRREDRVDLTLRDDRVRAWA